MNGQLFFTLFLIYLTGKAADSFCVMSSEGLHADLTRAVVRSSDWIKQFYNANTTILFPYRAGSVFATLRIAGHHCDTLLSDFKDRKGHNIEQTLKNYLDSVPDLFTIPTAELALIVQGVISICKDPREFHGYNLLPPIYLGLESFNKTRKFNNYFQYSLAVIALYNSGSYIPDSVVQGLIDGANRKVSYDWVDIDALLLTALSCITRSPLQSEVNKAMKKLVEQIISKQNITTGAFGDQFTSGLAVEALQAARVHTDVYLCDKAMRNILTYQDDSGSFGSILANIQVTPSLLGESLISLKRYACPEAPSPTPPRKTITANLQLVFNVINLTRTEPAVSVSVPEGTTAKNILDLAKEQNPCYTAKYTKYSWGHSVRSLCGVAENLWKSHYWMIYIDGRSAQYGVDGLKPKDGSTITFVYKKLSFK